MNRTIIQLMLDQLGLEHLLVADGLAAVKAAASGRFDLALMDIRMPRLDGLQASRRMRRAGFEAPIVAVTAEALEAKDAAMFDAVLAKPLSVSALTGAIAAVTAGPLARQARRA